MHAGLEALAGEKPDIVLIHDAARPFVTAAVISRAIDAAGRTGAAVPAIPVTDTIKQVGDSGDVVATPERARLRIAQTPQAFRFDVILDAHRRAAREGRSDFTDDAALAEWAGLTVATFEGDPANMKLTTPEDFVREEARLAAMLGDIRTGTGYDVHAFGDGDHLMICGVRVPHTRGFLAHSDGDVGLHALVDAIFGALADGDIGSHFPPSDPQWKGAASDRFLKYAVDRVTARGGRIANLEVTLICERPKIGPLRDTMRARIAEIPGVNISRIAVKATTSERLGFTGREEGIAATASATIRLPWSDIDMSGSDARALSRSLLDLCRMRKLTIATAESCTGGMVAGALTDIPGSSDVIDRGFVTYSNDAKRAMLGVKATTLATFGAVSKETATAMAIGALEKAGVDLAVSITGIAGPGGATPGKPVGLVHFAVAARDGRILHRECRFGAIGRSAVRQRSVVEALRMLIELARGPQAPAKPQRETTSRLRPGRPPPRRSAVKRRRPADVRHAPVILRCRRTCDGLEGST